MKKFVSFLAVLFVAGATVVASDVDLEGVKCVVAPKAASLDKSADYKEGKVYFCCGNCAGKFAADKEKFAVKANHQLVATKQYEQKGCPMSGKAINEETLVKLGGTEFGFCCNNCKGAFEGKADDKEKLDLVFNDKAFAKAFQKVKKEDSEN